MVAIANVRPPDNRPDTWRTLGAAANAVVEKVDPRRAWLLVCAAEHVAVERGEKDLDLAFETALRAHKHWFGR